MAVTRRSRSRLLALVGACTLGPIPMTGVAGATVESPPDGFEIPAERFTALDEAGLGWLFDGTGYPAQPAGVPWPTGEWPVGDVPAAVDAAALDTFLTEQLAPPEGASCCIEAVVAIHGGQLVVERYGNGWDPVEPHVSWSMAKSITQALLGVLVAEGRLDVFAPAAVPEWADDADPRHPITIDTLLHMRAGLDWQEEYEGRSDVIEMLFGAGAADRAHFAADRPLAADPDTVWNYSTGTSMILARIIADVVGSGDVGTQWADDVLFAPLGITSVRHDLDDTGVMSGGSAIDMTALDFARFGLLYLRGGEWDGTQLVPEAWVDYARMPIADTPEYGAHWWVGGTEDGYHATFAANGFNGQSITVVPELDLVVVVLANEPGSRPDLVAARVVQFFGEAAT